MIYFDYAATCPLHKDAAVALLKAATEYYGNSSSLHDVGDHASTLLENCRLELAELMGVRSEGLYFTSGGSESNFLAIQALLTATKKKGKHIISGAAEHPSVSGTLEKLMEQGYEISYVDFNEEGLVNLKQLQQAVRDDTVLITIQHGNSEIGTLQPLKEISALCKEHDIFFHSDCVHTFGKVCLKEVAKIVDSFSISGHKIYGPKGIGALYISPTIDWKPFYREASHERGMRPGTVNVPAVVAMTVAAQTIIKQREDHFQHFMELRKIFTDKLAEIHSKLIIYDFPTQLPSTIGMRVLGLEGQWMMVELNRLGFAVSTGSACSVGMQSPSKTMKALGVQGKEAKEFIRISFGIDTTIQDVENLCTAIKRIVDHAN